MTLNDSTRWIRTFVIIALLLALAGCSGLMQEDPNSQQTPWAGPADWENRMPGMPNQPY